MTNSELHTELDRRLDKAGSPYFTDAEKDGFLNDAMFQFVLTRYKQFELSELNRQDISSLVRRVVIKTGHPGSAAGDTKFFKLESVPRFMYILNMAGIFKDTCKGTTITLDYEKSSGSASDPSVAYPITHTNEYNLYENQEELTLDSTTQSDTSYSTSVMNSIKPLQHDDWYSASNDPFNKPSDSYPVYRVAGDMGSRRYVEIQSDTKPLAVVMDYLKHPNVIDKTNYPSNTIELPLQVHRHILDIAEKLMVTNVENQFRTQVENIEIKENIN
tara:strand:- start:75 stop:893 length:819 start_codon:yes stop_codon:yes gene_type:complete